MADLACGRQARMDVGDTDLTENRVRPSWDLVKTTKFPGGENRPRSAKIGQNRSVFDEIRLVGTGTENKRFDLPVMF